MYSIVFTKDCTYSHSLKSYNSPTKAYEAAIEYTLNNLLNENNMNIKIEDYLSEEEIKKNSH